MYVSRMIGWKAVNGFHAVGGAETLSQGMSVAIDGKSLRER